jgi:hypothetical protein
MYLFNKGVEMEKCPKCKKPLTKVQWFYTGKAKFTTDVSLKSDEPAYSGTCPHLFRNLVPTNSAVLYPPVGAKRRLVYCISKNLVAVAFSFSFFASFFLFLLLTLWIMLITFPKPQAAFLFLRIDSPVRVIL